MAAIHGDAVPKSAGTRAGETTAEMSAAEAANTSAAKAANMSAAEAANMSAAVAERHGAARHRRAADRDGCCERKNFVSHRTLLSFTPRRSPLCQRFRGPRGCRSVAALRPNDADRVTGR
jgi:hypothetical protein